MDVNKSAAGRVGGSMAECKHPAGVLLPGERLPDSSLSCEVWSEAEVPADGTHSQETNIPGDEERKARCYRAHTQMSVKGKISIGVSS